MSTSKKTAAKPAAIRLVSDDNIRAKVADDYVRQAVERVDRIRELVDLMYSALVVAYETHEGEPDVDDKSNFADCVLALHELGHDLRGVGGYTADRVEATAK